jgi:hypothetical protein
MNRYEEKRLTMRPALWVGVSGVSACALVWLGWGMDLYWNDVKLVNFLAAWIPFVLSVLLAFVPEHKMTTTKKLLWRGGVILVGFAWSVVLWHQQAVADAAARKDQENIVTAAVSKANEHSDVRIGSVQAEVKGVKTDIGGVKSDLKETKDALSGMVSKTAADLASSIGKVGRPDPPEPIRFEASLWPATDLNTASWPIKRLTLSAGADGSIPVEFTFRNMSGAAATNAEIWIQVCDACSFAKEPEKFDHPEGSDARVRHRLIQLLNPGVTMEKMTVSVKLEHPFAGFTLHFRYSCQGCKVEAASQELTVDEGVMPVAGLPSTH